MITRNDVTAHLERGMRVGFLSGRRDYASLRDRISRTVESDGAFETYVDMGAHPWPKHNGGQVGQGADDQRTDAPVTGGLLDPQEVAIVGANEKALIVYNRDWDVTIGITHNAINDNNVGSLETWAMDAGASFEKHMDYLCFTALNTGASASSDFGACYDGLPLFSASHVDPNASYTTVQDNEFTLALSNANFNTVYIAASKFKDSQGNYGGYNHSLLVHAVDLREEAAQITQNAEKSGTSNRDINVNFGEIDRMSVPGGWLDSTAWFVVDDGGVAKPINLQIRQSPKLVFWDDEMKKMRYYKWESRYEVFYGDWRLIAQGNT